MSAKTVTEEEGTGREAVLRAMQEAAECVSGKNGVPKGHKGTKGIVGSSRGHPPWLRLFNPAHGFSVRSKRTKPNPTHLEAPPMQGALIYCDRGRKSRKNRRERRERREPLQTLFCLSLRFLNYVRLVRGMALKLRKSCQWRRSRRLSRRRPPEISGWRGSIGAPLGALDRTRSRQERRRGPFLCSPFLVRVGIGFPSCHLRSPSLSVEYRGPNAWHVEFRCSIVTTTRHILTLRTDV